MTIGVGKRKNVPMTGDEVRLYHGDHNFHGHILAVFPRRFCKGLRVAVENRDGIIEIFDPKHLVRVRHMEHETRFDRYDD